MNIFEIDKEKCNRDGICADSCPSGLIVMDDDGFPSPVPEAGEVCIRCGHCVAVCPTGALDHSAVRLDRCLPLDQALKISQAQCEQLLKGRRSIRAFRKEPIPRADLERLIETARYAPTGHNAMNVEWLVIGDREEIRTLSGLTVDWMRTVMVDNPAFAKEFFLDRTVRRWEQGVDVILRDAPVLIVAHAPKEDRIAPMNGVIALTFLELAAYSMGMGCCWAGYLRSAAGLYPPLVNALNLPGGNQCLGALMVGYPRFSYRRIPTRKPAKVLWRP